MLFFSPMEQFEVFPVVAFAKLEPTCPDITNLAITLGAILFIAINFIQISRRNNNISVWAKIWAFCHVDNEKKIQNTEFFILIFIIIIFSNVIGVIPYSFTTTSHLILTFTLAFSAFLGINIVGTFIHRWRLIELFLPAGAPLLLSPLLVIIETVSYIARLFSLSIRLFANMMSGHTLMLILAGFAWSLITKGTIWFVLGTLVFTIVLAVSFLELAIAFLQTYVFVTLLTLYLQDVIVLH